MVERGLGVDKGELFWPPSPSPLLLLPSTASGSEGMGALACPKDDCSVPPSSQLVTGSYTRLDLCRSRKFHHVIFQKLIAFLPIHNIFKTLGANSSPGWFTRFLGWKFMVLKCLQPWPARQRTPSVHFTIWAVVSFSLACSSIHYSFIINFFSPKAYLLFGSWTSIQQIFIEDLLSTKLCPQQWARETKPWLSWGS